MPRPISWLPRVRELHRSVSNSVRSHYQRRDLQLLFKLQPRAAQKLLELLPRTEVGSALLVERNDLAIFLERVRDSADVPKLLDQIRDEKPAVTRNKIRTTVQTSATSPLLPDTVYLKRGKLEVSFRTIQDLAEALLALSKIMETPEFEKSYAREEWTKPAESVAPVNDLRVMYQELHRMEAVRPGHQMDTTERDSFLIQ